MFCSTESYSCLKGIQEKRGARSFLVAMKRANSGLLTSSRNIFCLVCCVKTKALPSKGGETAAAFVAGHGATEFAAQVLCLCHQAIASLRGMDSRRRARLR